MPHIALNVTFGAAAYAALRARLGPALARPRAMFTIEPLMATGVFPRTGDLVADLRMIDQVWRVQQRSMLVAEGGDATLSLLLAGAPQARLACDDDAPRVELTAAAQAALVAEYAGREQPSACGLLLSSLSAARDLGVGDVVQERAVSRHMFLIEERLFLWTAANQVRVRYLLDLGMKPEERQQLQAQ
ncbi:MAG TPA: hypothetical protein VKD22_12850 [Ramlibacter sp.]|nr:hypothetical protein [Ramlibacter sp.]